MGQAQQAKKPLLSQTIYDGKQLYRLIFRLANGLRRLKAGKTNINAWDVVVTRTMLDGITAKERKRAAKGEPPMHLFLAENTRLPLGLSLSLYGIQFSGMVEEPCRYTTCTP